eukprot:487327-Rhodomonas_salina.3
MPRRAVPRCAMCGTMSAHGVVPCYGVCGINAAHTVWYHAAACVVLRQRTRCGTRRREACATDKESP